MSEKSKSEQIEPEREMSDVVEESEPQILSDVVFSGAVKKGGVVEYKSSDPSRKIIILSEASQEPRPDVPYKVRIIEDTDPKNPKKGKFVGEIFFDTKDDQAIELVESTKSLKRVAKTPQNYDELARLYKEIERLYSPEVLETSLQEQYEKQVLLLQMLISLLIINAGKGLVCPWVLFHL